jgi:hypothetical protein
MNPSMSEVGKLTMYHATLEIESLEYLEEFFEIISDELILPNEKEDIRDTIGQADAADWPMELTLRVPNDEWHTFSQNHPDEAKILEPHMKLVHDNESDT